MSIDAMKMALDFINTMPYQHNPEAIRVSTALRAAIEAAEKQEPVAWLNKKISYMSVLTKPDDGGGWFPVFTTPQPAIPAGYLIPEEMPYKPFQSAFEDGYANGWNDCREAMLTAAPKPGGT